MSDIETKQDKEICEDLLRHGFIAVNDALMKLHELAETEEEKKSLELVMSGVVCAEGDFYTKVKSNENLQS